MTVIIPKDVYLTVVASTVRFANVKIPRDEWALVIGILIGRSEGNNV